MKKIFLILIGLMLISGSFAFAKPEVVNIERSDKHAKKLAAKNALKSVDVSAIEDPEARKAIQSTISYLSLTSKS